jgi:hypothetical protein
MATKKASKRTKRLKKAKKIEPTKPLTKVNWSGSAGDESGG